jgi:hypothetical protein
LAGAENLLEETSRLRAVIAKSHELIPAQLAQRATLQSQVGAAELSRNGDATKTARAQLDTLEAGRHHTIRGRNAAFDCVLRQEAALMSARATLESTRAAYSTRVKADFEQRYSVALAALQNLAAEGEALQAVLRTNIVMEMPCAIADADQKIGCHPWSIPNVVHPRLVRLPASNPAPVTIDKSAEVIGATLDKLDSALRFIEAVAKERRIGEQLPSRIGSRTFDPGGVYQVARELMNHADGLPHRVGELVDATLISLSALSRHVAAKGVTLLETGKQAAA